MDPESRRPRPPEEVGVFCIGCAAGSGAQRIEPLFAIVRSSSRIAGLLLRERARSIARRVRAACRRCRQVDFTVLIVDAFRRSGSPTPR